MDFLKSLALKLYESLLHFSKHNYLVLTQIHLPGPVFPHLKNGADLRPCFIKLLGILNMYTVSLVFEASYHKVMLFLFIYKLIFYLC